VHVFGDTEVAVQRSTILFLFSLFISDLINPFLHFGLLLQLAMIGTEQVVALLLFLFFWVDLVDEYVISRHGHVLRLDLLLNAAHASLVLFPALVRLVQSEEVI